MAWRRPGDKPLSGPIMVRLPMHICVTRPQWINTSLFRYLCLCEYLCTFSLIWVYRYVNGNGPNETCYQFKLDSVVCMYNTPSTSDVALVNSPQRCLAPALLLYVYYDVFVFAHVIIDLNFHFLCDAVDTDHWYPIFRWFAAKWMNNGVQTW